MTAEQELNIIKEILEKKKALDIDVIDVRDMTLVADYFVIATGTSKIHIKSIADGILIDGKEKGLQKLHCEGYTAGKWILVDLGDIIVHIFTQQEREYYDLESLWRETSQILDDAGESDERE